ncbi:MAG: hypothetical protein J4400_05705 [Candidatus Aenigmarchaeota archaeon]|nr:hypothetical protein [Candidatus Aenigmarchaeota archaeon]
MDALIFLWAFYWPLLFLRLKGLFSKTVITRRSLIVSLILAAAASYSGEYLYRYHVSQSAFVLMTIFAALSIAVLFLSGKPPGKRTQVKLIILAAYFHIFWQLLPGLSPYPFLLDMLVTLAIIALAKTKPKIINGRHEPQTAISGMWK